MNNTQKYNNAFDDWMFGNRPTPFEGNWPVVPMPIVSEEKEPADDKYSVAGVGGELEAPINEDETN